MYLSIVVAMGAWVTGQKRVLLRRKRDHRMWSKIVYIWAGRELDIKMMNYKQSWGRGVIETGSDLNRLNSGQKSSESSTMKVKQD